MTQPVSVAVSLPAHSALGSTLSYESEAPLAPGTLVRVPLGARECLGIVWDDAVPTATADAGGAALRPVADVLDALPPLTAPWRMLVAFAAGYYQRQVGELALAVLPQALRELDRTQLARRLKKRKPAGRVEFAPDSIAPTPEQALAIARIHAENGPFLLFGATGSGKTEVYLRAAAQALHDDPAAQVLVMVPEINLTPQLEARFAARFGAGAVVALHSGLTHPQRLQSWLAAHAGDARIVLGTRLAVFASMPRLRLIVVDEEHDPSYKQQEGARYSARDLAVLRGKLETDALREQDPGGTAMCRVVLGSATPSLESWHHSRPAEDGGRYVRLAMPSRIGDAVLPRVRRVDMRLQPRGTRIAPVLVDAIAEVVARGEQAMLFLNRRGYAPVLHCTDCGWKSDCPHCSAFQVFHKIDRSLRCHHCGTAGRVPRGCPSCGNPDIVPMGQGTEQLEEQLAALLAGLTRPDGSPLRLLRIDADSVRHKGALEAQLAQVHAGEVDVLVGTQMIAKGHDFRRIGLVAAVNPDGALFSSDFRAPERLFALLMQAAGRAGRAPGREQRAEMWLQTAVPDHALFAALKHHDFPAFAAQQLAERAQAALPPFTYQALVRAEARTQEVAQGFLSAASAAADGLPARDAVTLYPAVPMSLQRIANMERAQMLVESASRPALQHFLAHWQGTLHATRAQPAGKGLIRWAIDVDPLAI